MQIGWRAAALSVIFAFGGCDTISPYLSPAISPSVIAPEQQPEDAPSLQGPRRASKEMNRKRAPVALRKVAWQSTSTPVSASPLQTRVEPETTRYLDTERVDLAKADRHVAEGEKSASDQILLIEQMTKDGHNAMEAGRLLRNEETLRSAGIDGSSGRKSRTSKELTVLPNQA